MRVPILKALFSVHSRRGVPKGVLFDVENPRCLDIDLRETTAPLRADPDDYGSLSMRGAQGETREVSSNFPTT